MAYRTVEAIIKDAIGDAFKLYDDAAIPEDFIRQAVIFYNASEPFIWRDWPWHNRKVDEVEVTPDANGLIVFDGANLDVDMVRAVKAVGSDGDASLLVWNESDIRAAINGTDVATDTFQHLSDDASGNRRIKVSVDDGVSAYKILAFRRFVAAEVSGEYESALPSETPNDYRVLTWKIDQANAPLVAYISNELKKWNGKEGGGEWKHGLNGLKKDLNEQEATEQTISPANGNFGEIGAWH